MPVTDPTVAELSDGGDQLTNSETTRPTLVYNTSDVDGAELSSRRQFPSSQTIPLGPNKAVVWPAGSPLYARAATGNPTVVVMPGGAGLPPSAPEIAQQIANVQLQLATDVVVSLADGTTVELATGTSVGITGTPNVAVANSPTVGLSTGTSVGITGTPSVSVSGTTTVAGSVGITGTPTVGLSVGTNVGITGTPSVSVSGTTTVAGSVGITGTPNVAVANSPTVGLSVGTNVGITGTPSVSVSGTAAVSVSSGLADSTTAGTLNALNAAAQVALAGRSGAGMALAAGTLAAVITPEVSFDGGSTWLASAFYEPSTQTYATTITTTNPNAAAVRSIVTPPGTTNARVRVSTFTSGTAAVKVTATTAAGTPAPGNVGITGTPTVGLSVGASVGITGTPSVSVSGTATVAGNVGITGTPTVGLSVGASVGITGTPSVSVSGTATVVGSVDVTSTAGAVAGTPTSGPAFANRQVSAQSAGSGGSTGNITTAGVATTVVAAPGVGKALELHAGSVLLEFTAGSSTSKITVTIEDTSGTVLWTYIKATVVNAVNPLVVTPIDFQGVTLATNRGLKINAVATGGTTSQATAYLNINYVTVTP